MAPALMTAWLAFNIVTFSSAVLSIIGTRRAPWMTFLCYGLSICLHLLCTYMNKKVQNPQNMKSFLKLNYSFHIATMSFVFTVFQIRCISWTLALGFATFYQLLGFYVGQNQNSTSKLVGWALKLYNKLTNPPLARTILTSLEIMGILPTYVAGSKAIGIITSMIYLFWFALYRYALDDTHRAYWSNIYNTIHGFSIKLPSVLQTIINKILDNFSAMGALGIKLYTVGFNKTN